MRFVPIALLGLLLVCGSCATTGGSGRGSFSSIRKGGSEVSTPRPSPPKRAEVFILNVNRKQAFDALVNHLSGSAWRVAAANDYQLTLETPVKGALGFVTQVLTGVGKDPIYRMSVAGREVDGGSVISADLELISHPGHQRLEQVTQLKQPQWVAQVQQILDGARAEAAKRPASVPEAAR